MLRKKAEEKLIAIEEKERIYREETDLKKILHELQVHQIELEMQNDELRFAYTAAETALKNYTMLFDLSPMGYFTLDPEGRICELNFTGAEMLKERRFSLIKSNFKLYVSEDSKVVFNNFFRRIYAGNAKESCEVTLGYGSKFLCKVYMEGVVTEDDQKCLLSVVDLSKFMLLTRS
jgi:PAS domain-containing protein